MTPVIGGTGGGGAGGGGGASCVEMALTNCTGTTSGAWCVDQFLQSDPVPARFNGIWGAGTTNVWAVGSHVDSSGIFNSAGFIFHWDGCAWTRSPLSIAAGLREVWGMTENDVWAVGDGGTALHWNGSDWIAGQHRRHVHLVGRVGNRDGRRLGGRRRGRHPLERNGLGREPRVPHPAAGGQFRRAMSGRWRPTTSGWSATATS